MSNLPAFLLANRILMLCGTNSIPTAMCLKGSHHLTPSCTRYFYFANNYFSNGHLTKVWLMRHKQKSPGESGFLERLFFWKKKKWFFYFLWTGCLEAWLLLITKWTAPRTQEWATRVSPFWLTLTSRTITDCQADIMVHITPIRGRLRQEICHFKATFGYSIKPQL